MKKIVLLLLVSFIYVQQGQSQELTIEYNGGYGWFHMGRMQDFLEQEIYTDFDVKITDNFPAHFTNQVQLGLEWNQMHQAGLTLGFMNTVGNKGVSDHSGSVNYTVRTKGVRWGVFYRITPSDLSTGIFRPYFQLSYGAVSNKGIVEGDLVIHSAPIHESSKETVKGMNMFIEPALGLKIRIHNNIAFNLNAGYEFDLIKRFKFEGQKANIHPDWTGLRLQAGIITYFQLKN